MTTGVTGTSGGQLGAGRGFWTWAVGAGLAAGLVVTAASQHPLRAFDRLRDFDRTGLLVPNWRFFAPEPAQHDFHLLHRVLTADGEQTPWQQSTHIPVRRWLHTIWFPRRREGKALFDICTELMLAMGPAGNDVSDVPAYRMLAQHVELLVRREYAQGPLPQGFQFIIARHSGHDEEPAPEYVLASPFVALSPHTGARGAA